MMPAKQYIENSTVIRYINAPRMMIFEKREEISQKIKGRAIYISKVMISDLVSFVLRLKGKNLNSFFIISTPIHSSVQAYLLYMFFLFCQY